MPTAHPTATPTYTRAGEGTCPCGRDGAWLSELDTGFLASLDRLEV